MNRARLIEVYRKLVFSLGLNSRDVILSAGAACLLLGIRTDTSDLDVDIPSNDFDKLKNSGRYQIKGALDSGDELIVFSDFVDLHRGHKSRKTMEVAGVHIYSIDELIEQKTKMVNHPKRNPQKVSGDLDDIEKLKMLKNKPLSMQW